MVGVIGFDYPLSRGCQRAAFPSLPAPCVYTVQSFDMHLHRAFTADSAAVGGLRYSYLHRAA